MTQYKYGILDFFDFFGVNFCLQWSWYAQILNRQKIWNRLIGNFSVGNLWLTRCYDSAMIQQFILLIQWEATNGPIGFWANQLAREIISNISSKLSGAAGIHAWLSYQQSNESKLTNQKGTISGFSLYLRPRKRPRP